MLLNAILTGFRDSPGLSLRRRVFPRDDFLARTILGRSRRRVKAGYGGVFMQRGRPGFSSAFRNARGRNRKGLGGISGQVLQVRRAQT